MVGICTTSGFGVLSTVDKHILVVLGSGDGLNASFPVVDIASKEEIDTCVLCPYMGLRTVFYSNTVVCSTAAQFG